MKFDNSFRNKRIEIDENKIMNKFDCNNSITKLIGKIMSLFFKELTIILLIIIEKKQIYQFK